MIEVNTGSSIDLDENDYDAVYIVMDQVEIVISLKDARVLRKELKKALKGYTRYFESNE